MLLLLRVLREEKTSKTSSTKHKNFTPVFTRADTKLLRVTLVRARVNTYLDQMHEPEEAVCRVSSIAHRGPAKTGVHGRFSETHGSISIFISLRL